ncbi:MAG: hypothetical protein EOO18_05635 [Chryseobacterium sp.]|nr:MAG: hypothetical protein EOO18_05635 [Chryseobacterium sp.]
MGRIDIHILYRSDDHEELYFSDISSGVESMNLQAYQPSNFWSIDGGIEIRLDEYKVIFRSFDFYVLLGATTFLMETLYFLQESRSTWLDVDNEFPDSATCVTFRKDKIVFSRVDDTHVSLSFLRRNDHQLPRRSDRYFSDVLLEISQWVLAVKRSLGEYFSVLSKVAESSVEDRTLPLLRKYHELWTAVKD